jgi:hypothetical protein
MSLSHNKLYSNNRAVDGVIRNNKKKKNSCNVVKSEEFYLHLGEDLPYAMQTSLLMRTLVTLSSSS